MIPNELVYRAAQAMWETGTTSKWRDDVWAAPHLTRARAALEAVAADIWDQGYRSERKFSGTPNPYRASETA